MAEVRLTRHLQRFLPSLPEQLTVEGETVRALVHELDRRFPGFAGYVVDETGALRRHVNVFLRDEPICDRRGLSDRVGVADRVFIVQALSGGA